MINLKLVLKMFEINCFLLFLTFSFLSASDLNGTTQDEFIPSKEWKVVKPDQKIPPGLHIRSNLQTGITEAKLLDTKNETDRSSSMILLNNEKENITNSTNQSLNYSADQLKRMLKNIKDDGSNNKNTESIEINGTRYRSYDQLKQELESIQMNFKTDLEIIQDLMKELQYNKNIGVDRKLVILQDLEYYLHQIDNAQNFVDLGGLSILHEFIDGDIMELKSEAFRCLASALQSNSKVKVESIKNGTLSRLLVQLQQFSDKTITNRILVAISSITRQFPIAQIAFITGGGMKTIGRIFDHYFAIGDTKITLKLITLISDWLKERDRNYINFSVKEDLDRIKQYEKIHLHYILFKDLWCERINKMMSATSDLSSIDYYEKLIQSIINIYPTCHSVIDRNEVLTFLSNANLKISQLSSDPDDLYFSDMLKLVDQARVLMRSGKEHGEL